MQRNIVLSSVLILASLPVVGTAQSSPFQRTGGKSPTTAQASAKEQPFEFAGLVKIGANPMVCVTEIASKRSHWLKVGQTVSGITLVSLDAENSTITMQHGGQTHLLTLAESTFDSESFAQYQPIVSTDPIPSAGIAETVPLTNKEKAADARMLVSDLLEIGLIQRKAYEEAKAEEVAAKRAAAKED